MRIAIVLIVALSAQTAAAADLSPRHTLDGVVDGPSPEPQPDLASFVRHSDAIVVVRRLASFGTDDDRVGTYAVTRSLRGPLAAGEQVVVEERGYHLTSGAQDPPLAIDDVALLFLYRGDGEIWKLAGLRDVFHGHVLRFTPRSNPGPLEAVPQLADPDRSVGSASLEAGITMDELILAIERASPRADAVRAALELPPGPARRARLLALLPPVRDTDAELGLPDEDPADALSREIVAALDDGSVEAEADMIDAYARTRVPTHTIVRGDDANGPAFIQYSERMLERAADRRADLAHRLAALSFFAAFGDLDDAMRRQLVALARDPSRVMRVAALGTLAGRAPEHAAEAFAWSWCNERDGWARAAVLRLADEHGMGGALRERPCPK